MNTRFLLSAVVAVVAFLFAASSAQALPKNFRNVDKFYVGGMPEAEDMEEFHVLGVETIISLHRMDAETQRAAKRVGLEIHTYPWRTRLVDVEEIMAILEDAPTGTVFVHCQHGADRTGAVTAYWLTTRRGLDAWTALAMVISPKLYHIKGLEALASEYLVSVGVDDRTLGRYSGARNGGLEGLKIRGGQWYTRLARSYLELTVGPPLREPRERFWGEHGTGKF